MKVVYVIGGMGSGKSTVMRLFEAQGASILDLDVLGHEVLKKKETKHELEETFGSEVIDEQGEVDRKTLALKAFRTKENTDLLNGIMTKLIMELFQKRIEHILKDNSDQTDLVVEVSAYNGPNGGFGGLADMVIAVVAPEELRIKRSIAHGFTEEDVRQRMRQQPSDEERIAWADFVILNDVDEESLAQQVEDVWERLHYMSGR